MAQREPAAGVAPVLAPVGRAVVGHDPLDRDAMARKPGGRAFQERHRAGLAFVRQHFAVGQARGVVDADVDRRPAGATLGVTTRGWLPGPPAVGGPERRAGDPMADRLDPPELLVSMCSSSLGPLRRWRRRRSISAMRAAGTPWRQRCGAELRSISAAILPVR
jgi:hypothetical protein